MYSRPVSSQVTWVVVWFRVYDKDECRMCEPAALAKGASSWWWSSAILQRRLQGGLNSAWWVAETWPFDLTKGNDHHFSVSLLFPACFEPLSEAVVDSGTSLLAVPTPIFPELYEMLRRSVTKVFGEIGWEDSCLLFRMFPLFQGTYNSNQGQDLCKQCFHYLPHTTLRLDSMQCCRSPASLEGECSLCGPLFRLQFPDWANHFAC